MSIDRSCKRAPIESLDRPLAIATAPSEGVRHVVVASAGCLCFFVPVDVFQTETSCNDQTCSQRRRIAIDHRTDKTGLTQQLRMAVEHHHDGSVPPFLADGTDGKGYVQAQAQAHAQMQTARTSSSVSSSLSAGALAAAASAAATAGSWRLASLTSALEPHSRLITSASTATLSRLDALLARLPFSHSRSNQACVLLALLIALVVAGHRFGWQTLARRRKEARSERVRRELIELEAKKKREGGGEKESHQRGKGGGRSTVVNDGADSAAAAAAGERSPIARKRSGSTLRSAAAAGRGRSSSVVSSSGADGLLSPLSATTSITTQSSTTPDRQPPQQPSSPSPSPSPSQGSAKDRQKAKKAEKRKKAAASASNSAVSLTALAEGGQAVQEKGDDENGSAERRSIRNGSQSSGYSSTRRDSAVSPRSSSLGLSLMTNGSSGFAGWRDPIDVPLPDSPTSSIAHDDFRMIVVDDAKESSRSVATRHRESLPAFPPTDEGDAGATMRAPSTSRNGARRNSSRKASLPVGAPGWNRDDHDVPSSSAIPSSPQPSTTSLSSSSRSPMQLNKQSHELLVASTTRERDQLAAEISRLQKAAQSAKDREGAAKKQAQRSKDEASKAFSECIQAREDIARARTDADRALAREAAMARELSDLKRDLFMRDQETRRREAEVRPCFLASLRSKLILGLSFQLESVLQQRSAQLAQAYHTLMLLQQGGLTASANSTPVNGLMAGPPYSPFPAAGALNGMGNASIPPSPHPPRRPSEAALTPNWLGHNNGAESPARMPMLHSPGTSPMLFRNGQVPQAATLPVPQLSNEIANSVLKHRRDSSRSNGVPTKDSGLPSAESSHGTPSASAATGVDTSREEPPTSPTESVDSNPPLVFASIHHDADQLRAFVEAERGRRHSDRRPSASGVPELSRSTSPSASPASFSPQLHPNGANEPKVRIRSASSQGTAEIDVADGTTEEKKMT